MYLAVVAGLDPSAGVPPELIDAVARALAADDVTGAASLISDEVLDLSFSGTPDRIAAQAEALYEAGARRVSSARRRPRRARRRRASRPRGLAGLDR